MLKTHTVPARHPASIAPTGIETRVGAPGYDYSSWPQSHPLELKPTVIKMVNHRPWRLNRTHWN